MSRRAAWIVVATSITIFLAVLGLSSGALQTFPVAFAIAAFPALAFIASALVAVLAAALAVVSQARAAAACAATVVVASVVLSFSNLGSSATQPSESITTPTADQLSVVSWNTDQSIISEQQLRDVVRASNADIVVLPEYFTAMARSTLADLAHDYGMQIVGSEASAATVLISRELGNYRLAEQETTPPWAGFIAESDVASSPTLLVAHLQRPQLTGMGTWQEHISWVERTCNEHPNLLAVGDFNSTQSNLGGPTVGQCMDAAASLGQESPGTWPASLPAQLGAAIDRAFIGADWDAVSFAVLDDAGLAGSDHRPIAVIVEPAS